MKLTRTLFFLAAAMVLLLAACGPTAAPAQEPVQQPAVQQPPATEPPAPPPVEEPPAAEPPQPEYAPTCQSAPAGCAAPEIEMIEKAYCIKKVPYAIMSVPPGTTYESLDPELDCVDQMHSDGNMRVSCHSVKSRQLWSFDVKFCNSACTAPALDMNSGQCQEGYGYDAANQCCAAPSTDSDAGCVVYQVDLGACPMPNN